MKSFALTSSLGADPGSRFEYTRNKGQLENALRQLRFLSLTIVHPSVLVGHRERRRRDERLAQIVFRIATPILPRRLRLSPADGVAALLLEGAIEAPPGIHLKTNDDMRPATAPP